jgi:glycosyltransferase involved in cell wall biosynthesis
MKILMTADTIGGVWTYAIELARALRPRGVHVVLATMGRRLDRAQRSEVAALANVSVRESDYRLEWMRDAWPDVARAGDWLLAIEDAERPDIIHLNGYTHAALPWIAPVVVVGHSCVLSWWEAVRGGDRPDEWDVYAGRVREGLEAADAVVAPSHAMARLLARHYGLADTVTVVPNGRDPVLFSPGTKEPFVFAAGRVWDEAKNLAVLDAVAPDVPWPVFIAGDTTSPGGERLPMRHARALGHVDRATLGNWLGRAGIYAFPARYEPFGLSVLEAALAGCALVLGDIPSLREIWGPAATFVEPNDRVGLARAIARLCDDETLRRAHAAQARRHALMFGPERMAEGYLAVYAHVRSPSRWADQPKERVACAS